MKISLPSQIRQWRPTRTALIAALILTLVGVSADTAEARRFGFRGGFRGGFGGFRSSFRGGFRGGFRGSRFTSFRRSGFRGFRGFRGSRFNSLAFRSRRFGFGGFNRVSRFHGFNRYGFGGYSRFSGFRRSPYYVTYSHFPSSRFHSGFGTFHPTHLTSRSFAPYTVSSTGWNHLAAGRTADARLAFASQISSGKDLAAAQVGMALAHAYDKNLDQGIVEMKKAFAHNAARTEALMFDESLQPAVERVTELYEDRHEKTKSANGDTYMLAALYQMQGDPEMAAMAADYALKETPGGTSSDLALKNLNSLIQRELHSVPMTTSRGWDLLAENCAREALSAFVSDIEGDVQAGAPKLGYALASAALGDLDRGVWAMRRAFAIDPEGASDVMLSGNLRPIVAQIMERYEQDLESNGMDSDNSFMLATLYQLQGDVEAAEVMLKNSSEHSDSYVAGMIKEEMEVSMSKEAWEPVTPTETAPTESLAPVTQEQPAEQQPLVIVERPTVVEQPVAVEQPVTESLPAPQAMVVEELSPPVP